MPITLSSLDSVHFWSLLIQLKNISIDWLVGSVNIEWSIQSIKQMISFSSKFMVSDLQMPDVISAKLL